ncbi:diguanylate cyclase [Billgrantia azerbaijanica]|nr:diguanylate cyclase [Halomonas azerbaijanica]
MLRPLASLRHRFLLALGSVLALALLALGLVARYQITPILLEEERRYATAELDRAERALDNELGHMQRLVEDWAWWEDTYQFVRGERPEYVDSNLYEGTLATLDLQLMVFFSADDEPYWTLGFDASGRFATCTAETQACPWADHALRVLQERITNGLTEDSHTWLMAAPRLALIGVSPIYKGDDDTVPPSGWLAMVRPLSATWIQQLRETTGIDLTVDSVPMAASPPAEALSRLSATRMRAFRDVEAMSEGHQVRLAATLPRQRYQASLETFRFALYWTSGVLVVAMIVVLLLLESIVLKPLRQFARFAQRLKEQETLDDTPLILLGRQDEIGMLVREFQQLHEHQRAQKALLLNLSQHDPLTGLANRRLFDEKLDAALAQVPEESDSVVTLMLDVDHFKPYNDHYGHPQGDECLVTLAEHMTRHFSAPGQLVARTGGEEFSVLLPRTSLADAQQQAAALGTTIQRLAIPHATSPVAPVVTVSIGVAVSTASHPLSATRLMSRADLALYRAKAHGRNRVEAYREAEQPTTSG